LKEVGEEGGAVVGVCQPLVLPNLINNIIEGSEGARGKQGIAGADVNLGVVAVFVTEGPDQGGLSDARFAAKHNTMAFPGRDVLVFFVHRVKVPGSFDKINVHWSLVVVSI
jgi:hypothetical protein